MKDGVRAAVWEGGWVKEVGAREGKLRPKLLKAKKSPNFSLKKKKPRLASCAPNIHHFCRSENEYIRDLEDKGWLNGRNF